jgi:hypothetical protein
MCIVYIVAETGYVFIITGWNQYSFLRILFGLDLLEVSSHECFYFTDRHSVLYCGVKQSLLFFVIFSLVNCKEIREGSH